METFEADSADLFNSDWLRQYRKVQDRNDIQIKRIHQQVDVVRIHINST